MHTLFHAVILHSKLLPQIYTSGNLAQRDHEDIDLVIPTLGQGNGKVLETEQTNVPRAYALR